MLLVGESSGGWGFIARDGNAIFVHGDLTRSWDLSNTLKFPESVIYDSERDILYVSNFLAGGNEFISKVGRDGEIEELRWVTGLDRPTGLCLVGTHLFAVERAAVAEIDVTAGEIVARHPVPEPGLPNDVACDDSGAIFVSDSQKNVVYKVEAGKVSVWLENAEISRPNGLLLDGERLLVGNTGDGCLKAVTIGDRTVETIACLGGGSIMDGIRSDGHGNYIVSDYNGRVFLIAPSGEMTALLNTSARGINTADLEYVPEHGLLVIPTLNGNQLIAYEFDSPTADR
jgi:sugar lactone lactonase YvrE